MNIESFVISLDRATERKPQVARIKSLSPVVCHELSAVDGRLLSPEERDRWVQPYLYRPRYPFALRPGEIGVFLSHRKAWQAIVDRNLDAGLILEDDVDIDLAVFGPGFQLATSRIAPHQIYKFGNKGNGLGATDGQPPQITARKPIVVPLGATAQLVGIEAARRLLALTETFDRPIDSFLQLSWLTGVAVIVVEPSGITEVSHQLGGSTIQLKQRPVRETAYRNFIRPIYRSQIRAMSTWSALVS